MDLGPIFPEFTESGCIHGPIICVPNEFSTSRTQILALVTLYH